MTSLFLHYIFITRKYWESNWILPSFLSAESETKDSEKPDGLHFVQTAEFESLVIPAHIHQILGSTPVQGGLEGKRHPRGCH